MNKNWTKEFYCVLKRDGTEHKAMVKGNNLEECKQELSENWEVVSIEEKKDERKNP